MHPDGKSVSHKRSNLGSERVKGNVNDFKSNKIFQYNFINSLTEFNKK